jgi:uncharacterized membrane protein
MSDLELRLRAWSEERRNSFWFVPAVITALCGLVAIGLLALDMEIGGRTQGPDWLYSGQADGARALLGAIAGSMITVAGVTFSVTITSLVLASQQFGPRMLRNFLRDLGNQIVLGVFIGTFFYCLIVLRSVRSAEEDVFVPHIAVSFAMLLAVASVAMLIYFIHHISTSIQATNIIDTIARDLEKAIRRAYPEAAPHSEDEYWQAASRVANIDFSQAVEIEASHGGYLRAINENRLVQVASDYSTILIVERHSGEFLVRGTALAKTADPQGDPEFADRVRDCFELHHERSPLQDVQFYVDQLVEIAVRALSPGVNDPFTAVACLDRLGLALRELAGRRFPPSVRVDGSGEVRLIIRSETFGRMVNAAFNQIRQYGAGSVAVTIRLMEVLTTIMQHARTDEHREAILRQARMVERGSRALPEEEDQRDVDKRYRGIVLALERSKGNGDAVPEAGEEAPATAG